MKVKVGRTFLRANLSLSRKTRALKLYVANSYRQLLEVIQLLTAYPWAVAELSALARIERSQAFTLP